MTKFTRQIPAKEVEIQIISFRLYLRSNYVEVNYKQDNQNYSTALSIDDIVAKDKEFAEQLMVINDFLIRTVTTALNLTTEEEEELVISLRSGDIEKDTEPNNGETLRDG